MSIYHNFVGGYADVAEKEDIELVFRGDDITLNVTIDGEGSIAAWTFEFGLWERETEIDPDGLVDILVDAESDDGIEITDAVGREISITLLAADIASLDGNKKYPYRIRRTNSGSRATITYGTIKIKY